jgi:hypothetical protein
MTMSDEGLVRRYVGRFDALGERAQQGEEYEAPLAALAAESRSHAASVTGQLKLKLQALETPEAVLLNKSDGPGHHGLTAFYRAAIRLLALGISAAF